MLLRSLHRRSAPPGVDALKALVPPPDSRTAVNWTDIHKRFGLHLPDDYELIVERYGAGSFDDALIVWVPDGRGGDDLFARATDAAEKLEDARDSPTHSWTEPDGSAAPADLGGDPLMFTPWGTAAGGYYGYWHRTHRDPNKWPILFTDLDGVWLYHREGLAQFMVDLLSHRYPCTATSSDSDSHHFVSATAVPPAE